MGADVDQCAIERAAGVQQVTNNHWGDDAGGVAQGVEHAASHPDQMGFGDLEFAAHTHPRLSTVNIDGGRIGLRTAELLLQRIDGSLARGECAEDVGFNL